MKYRIVSKNGDEKIVVVETDDLYLASLIADNLEKNPFYYEVYIEKEDVK